MTPTTSLTDLQKILIPVAVGFLLAICAEPLKLWVSDRYKRRALRKRCYEEIYTLYSALQTGLKAYRNHPDEARTHFGTGKEFLIRLVSNLGIGRLTYAVEQEGRLLFETDIYPVARRLVRTVNNLDFENITPDAAAEFANLITAHIDNQVDMGFLDGRILTRLAYAVHWGWRKHPFLIADELRSLEIGYRDLDALVERGTGHPFVARLKRRLRHVRDAYRYYSRMPG